MTNVDRFMVVGQEKSVNIKEQGKIAKVE
jgi:hypothetical protein